MFTGCAKYTRRCHEHRHLNGPARGWDGTKREDRELCIEVLRIVNTAFEQQVPKRTLVGPMVVRHHTRVLPPADALEMGQVPAPCEHSCVKIHIVHLDKHDRSRL